VAYYRTNAADLDELPWERGAELTAEERAAVVRSLQAFQLGETSEGRHLMEKAREYAERHEDLAYEDAVRAFIAEEGRHSADLGHFLTLAGAPLLQRDWSDSVFRWLRHRAGLELFLVVLLTAEIIALVYYRAIHEATRSTLLRALCRQLLRDEVAHVRFHCERLALLRAGRSPWLLRWTCRLQRWLMAGTCLVVGWAHRRALRAGGYTGRRFRQAMREKVRAAMRWMDPGRFG
jgi:hypothetical protein